LEQKIINKCKEKVSLGIGITFHEAKSLINISEKQVRILASAANEITRKFNGIKVDIEQLNNIKKNSCSEDCIFCAQSAFQHLFIQALNEFRCLLNVSHTPDSAVDSGTPVQSKIESACPQAGRRAR